MLPLGVVTFVFTDIEGSTRLLQELGARYRSLLEDHAALVRASVQAHSGQVVSTEGDSFFLAFASPLQAVEAVVELQRNLAEHEGEGPVRVRVGIHTGQGVIGGDNYIGLDVNRTARIANSGHGGQVLMSQSTTVLVSDDLPAGVSIISLGEHRLKDLARREHLYQLVIDGLSSQFPTLRTLEAIPNNLPAQLSSFVGRRELEALTLVLDEARLVTLTGPGGSGKTRLSLQAAAEMMNRFPDGVWFVPLAAITDPALVTTAVGSALGLQPANRDPDGRLTDYLRTKDMLVVLDNFEQVLGAAGRVATWLQGAPRLRILVSSRAPLHISGEREFPVPPLTLPDQSTPLDVRTVAEFEAVALFVDRARSVMPAFVLDSTNAAAVAGIVMRLDGLPLAIELAAARVRLLSVDAIRERLKSRLSLLTGGARDLPERQQTLRNAIAWSYDLLDETHRLLFNRLGVFVGGFAFEQAEAVCRPGLDVDLLDGLATLVDQSLLRASSLGPDTGFFMLETIREFAVSQLDAATERDEVRGRHASAYRRLAEQAGPRFTRRGQREWLDRIGRSHDNLRAAITWSMDTGDAEAAQSITGNLWRFWQMRGFLSEGRGRAEAALALGPGTPESRIKALDGAGGLAYWQADIKASGAAYAEQVRLARELGNPREIILALYNDASSVAIEEGVQKGMELVREALSLAEQLGDRELIGTGHWALGATNYLASELGGIVVRADAETALSNFRTAAEYLNGSDAIYEIGWNERMTATCLLAIGEKEEAIEHLRASLRLFVEAGDMSALPLHVTDYVQLALVEGDDENALRLAGAAGALQSVSETRLLDLLANGIAGLEGAIGRVGRDQATALAAEGSALSVDEILSQISQA